jgi:hypothetical protein
MKYKKFFTTIIGISLIQRFFLNIALSEVYSELFFFFKFQFDYKNLSLRQFFIKLYKLWVRRFILIKFYKFIEFYNRIP